MSSSGEFSTLSSGEATGTGDDSLPSSREATAEAAGSDGGYVPLREFLDRFSLPRVVRVEGACGRPILLYKQQQRSLRVTATLLMHRYRHDVKVGPEIVIPEGYPAELMRNSWSRSRASHARKYRLSKNLRRNCAWRCYRDLTLLREELRPRQESSASTRRQAGCQTTLSRATLRFRKRHPQWWSVKEAETKTNLKVIFSSRDHRSNSKLANGTLNQTSSRANLTPALDPLPVDVTAKAIKRESKESRSDEHETAALPAASSSRQKIHVDKSLAPLSTSNSYSSRFSARTVSTEETTESNLSRTNTSGTTTDLSGTYAKTDIAKDGYWIDAGRPHTCPGSVSSDLVAPRNDSRLCGSRNRNGSKNSFTSISSGDNSSRKSGSAEGRYLRNRRTSLSMAGLKDHAVRKRTMLATKTGAAATDSSSTRSCLELSTHERIPSSSPPRKRSNTENIFGEISAIRGNTELHRCLDSLRSTVHENAERSNVNLLDSEKTCLPEKALLLLFANAELHGEVRVASTTQLSKDNLRAESPADGEQLVGSRSMDETIEESAKMLDHRDHEMSEIRSSRQSLKRAEAESNLSMHLDAIESRSVTLGDSDLLEITKVLETQSSEEDKELQKSEAKNRSNLSEQFSPFVESSVKEQITPKGNRHRQRSLSKVEDDEVTIVKEVRHPEVEICEIHESRLQSFGPRSGDLYLDEDYHFLLSLYQQMTRIPRGWFSVVSASSGTGSARVYRRVGALVRAGVPAFLLAKPLRAYTLTHSKMENGNLRAHYTKTTVRAGEVLRLAAVFQDTRRAPISTGVSGVIGSMPEGKSSRSSERDQYAQCLDSRGHELFAPLSTRGEFYATCQSGNLDTGSDAVLYRVHQLARRDLPLKVRLVAGPLPVPLPRDYTGLMQLEGATRGPIVLGCAVPLMPERPLAGSAIPELLELMATGPTAPRVKRARLGCPSEARLLASPKMQRLLSACRRALDQRATEPRVAPPKAPANNSQLKELNLKEIKSKPETTPILQSLKNGLEHIKKTTIRDRSQTRQSGNGNGFLDKISRIAHGGRSRNPAKKSASFTFAVRPEIGMRSPERYASLESEAASLVPVVALNRQQVQRSVSTSVLEVPTHPDQDPPYSRVRDSLTPLPRTPPAKNEDIYAEICEPTESVPRDDKYQPTSGRKGTRERDRGYVKLASHPDLTISHGPANGEDEEGIYNTVC